MKGLASTASSQMPTSCIYYGSVHAYNKLGLKVTRSLQTLPWSSSPSTCGWDYLELCMRTRTPTFGLRPTSSRVSSSPISPNSWPGGPGPGHHHHHRHDHHYHSHHRSHHHHHYAHNDHVSVTCSRTQRTAEQKCHGVSVQCEAAHSIQEGQSLAPGHTDARNLCFGCARRAQRLH
jgi:hypothetical protein